MVFPFDVERDDAGNAYVVDLVNRGVHKFDSANNLVGHWGSLGSGPGQFLYSLAIGLNTATGDVYVADFGDFGSSPSSRIQRFDASGKFLGEFGSVGTAEGQFSIVRGISVDPSGNVFVADTGNDRIQQFTASGQFVRMWGKDVVPGGGGGFEECMAGCKQGETGGAEGEFAFPADVAASGFGIFVSDSGNARIQRFNLAGGQVNFLGMGGRDVVPGGGGGYETCVANCKAGVSGAQDDGTMAGPEGLDVNNVPPGRVWVADSGNERIQRYNLGLTPEAKFGSSGSGDGQFDGLEGLAEGGGQVVASDVLLRRFQRFDGDSGAFQSKSGPVGDSTLVSPGGIGTGPGGVYVPDDRHRVSLFDRGGTLISSWGKEGTAPGELRFPEGVAADGGGNIFVADRGNSRIQRFDADGDLLGAWGSKGSAGGQFDGLADVTIGPSGSVFAIEQGNDRVQKFNPIGGFLGTWGAEGATNGQFDHPRGIGSDAQGNVYVADTDNNRVQKFDSGGKHLTTWGSPGVGDGQLSGPTDVATDAAGNAFVVDRQNNRVQRFDLDGNFLGRWGANDGDGTPGDGPGEFFLPGKISVDENGDVYVLDGGNNRVQRFAGAAGAGGGTVKPELEMRGRGRQKAGRLKVKAGCGEAPCAVEISGRVVARSRRSRGSRSLEVANRKSRKVVRELKSAEVTLAADETSTLRLKLKRHRRSVRKVNRFLKRGYRGKAVLNGSASSAGGDDQEKLKIKLKRNGKKKRR